MVNALASSAICAFNLDWIAALCKLVGNSFQDEFIAHYNQLDGRRDLRSTVHSGMRVKFNSSRKVAEVNLIFNGLEDKAFRVARITQKLIIGRYFLCYNWKVFFMLHNCHSPSQGFF